MSEDSFHLLTKDGTTNIHSFGDYKRRLDHLIKLENDNAFQYTEFSLESIEVNGTLLSTSCKKTCDPYSYLIKGMEVATDKYAVFLCLDVCDPCVKVKSINIDKSVS